MPTSFRPGEALVGTAAQEKSTILVSDAPSGYLLPDLADLVVEFGASYPLLGYLVSADEESDEPTALDPVIYAGLLHP